MVNIKAHSWNTCGERKQGLASSTKTTQKHQTVTYKTGQSSVKSHTRKVDIKQRQFMLIDKMTTLF
jgi:hypothetical protein